MSSAKFSSASDVWSFGIVVVEIFQDGGLPYPGETSNPAVIKKVNDGIVHPQPAGCSATVYNELKKCFAFDPKDRPGFTEIGAFFSSLAGGEQGGAIANGSYEQATTRARAATAVPVPDVYDLGADQPQPQAQGYNLTGDTGVQDDMSYSLVGDVQDDMAYNLMGDMRVEVPATVGGPAEDNTYNLGYNEDTVVESKALQQAGGAVQPAST